jgi:hypothetical protein
MGHSVSGEHPTTHGIDGGSLSTAQLVRPAPVAQDTAGGVLHRVGQLRHSSPGRLQLTLAVLLTLGLLTGLVTGLTAAAAASGTDDLGDRAQPLLVEAETIYSRLADADTTAAQAFLAGGLEPAALTARYEEDLKQVNEALTSAARRTPEDSPAAASIRRLSSGVTDYAARVASARANNRQGLPIGASYLSSASALNRETLQPQAQELFTDAQAEVDAGYGDARSSWWTALLVILLLALFVALLVAQRSLSRKTHRTFNVPLVAATVVTALLALGAGAALSAQRSHLAQADEQGSTPVALLAEARIAALNERGFEALTLVGRAGEPDPGAETTFGSTLDGLLGQARTSVDGDASDAVRRATAAQAQYVGAHKKVRQLDNNGDYDGAVALAVGTGTSATFTKVTDEIGAALEDRKSVFTSEIDDAGRGLGSLTVLGPLLALLVCALAYAGIRARLEEYR